MHPGVPAGVPGAYRRRPPSSAATTVQRVAAGCAERTADSRRLLSGRNPSCRALLPVAPQAQSGLRSARRSAPTGAVPPTLAGGRERRRRSAGQGRQPGVPTSKTPGPHCPARRWSVPRLADPVLTAPGHRAAAPLAAKNPRRSSALPQFLAQQSRVPQSRARHFRALTAGRRVRGRGDRGRAGRGQCAVRRSARMWRLRTGTARRPPGATGRHPDPGRK